MDIDRQSEIDKVRVQLVGGMGNFLFGLQRRWGLLNKMPNKDVSDLVEELAIYLVDGKENDVPIGTNNRFEAVHKYFEKGGRKGWLNKISVEPKNYGDNV